MTFKFLMPDRKFHNADGSHSSSDQRRGILRGRPVAFEDGINFNIDVKFDE